MPLTTLHLIRLKPNVETEKFLNTVLQTLGSQIIVASHARHVVISPTLLDVDQLLQQPWDLMFLIRAPRSQILADLKPAIAAEYTIPVGVPSRILSTYAERNAKLRQNARNVPLTGTLDNYRTKDSSQNLELSPALLSFMDELSKVYTGPVTMLNLLHFHPDGKPKYYRYGQEFIPVAGKRGGDAKIVGNVVAPTPDATTLSTGQMSERKSWNEISIVHYPSIKHFCDMLASEEYQAINEKYRLAALKDTFLLCTIEDDQERRNSSPKL